MGIFEVDWFYDVRLRFFLAYFAAQFTIFLPLTQWLVTFHSQVCFLCLSAVPTAMQGIMGNQKGSFSQVLRGKAYHTKSVSDCQCV